MDELKIVREVKTKKINEFEVYGKKFDTEEAAKVWKKEVERDLNASWFTVKTTLDTEGNLTETLLVKVYDWLGINGVIIKLKQMGIPLLVVTQSSSGKYVKNVEIEKLKRFDDWEEMINFKNEGNFKLILSVTENNIRQR